MTDKKTEALRLALEAGFDEAGSSTDEYYEAGIENIVRLVELAAEYALAEKSAQQKPVGWFESPLGEFRANHLYKIKFPSSLLSWQVPLYMHSQPIDADVGDDLTAAYMAGLHRGKEMALAEPAQQQQETVAWNVIDPFGKIVATEKDAIRGWARIQGYKPTVESLLGFQEQGWRVVPTPPPASKPQPAQQQDPVGYVRPEVLAALKRGVRCGGERFSPLADEEDGLTAPIYTSPPAQQGPVAQCTESDLWNCKYCRKNKSCDALEDPRNFGQPVRHQGGPEARDKKTEALAEKSAQQKPVAWRELCRRLYFELYWCDRQMMETLDENGEPMWTQGKTVRDVLADAKAALETSPPNVPTARASKPLTDDQLWSNDQIMSLNADLGWHMDTIRMFARAIEAAHGIKESP